MAHSTEHITHTRPQPRHQPQALSGVCREPAPRGSAECGHDILRRCRRHQVLRSSGMLHPIIRLSHSSQRLETIVVFYSPTLPCAAIPCLPAYRLPYTVDQPAANSMRTAGEATLNMTSEALGQTKCPRPRPRNGVCLAPSPTSYPCIV
jgi:hypothetical protein